MIKLRAKNITALQSAQTKPPIDWGFIAAFSAMLIGFNLFSKITLLAFLVYYSYKNRNNVPDIFASLKNVFWLVCLALWAVASTQWSVVPKVSYDLIATQISFLVLCALMAKYATDIEIAPSLKLTSIFVLVMIVIFAIIFPREALSNVGFKAFYPQKNNLGVVLAICIISIFYTANRHWKDYGLLAIALFLLVLSQSKTSLTALTTVLAITGCIYLARRQLEFISRFARDMILFLAKGIAPILYLIIILMVLFRDTVADYLIQVLPYEFLTGRGELWLMVLSRTRDDLLAGLGLGTFWSAGALSEVAQTSLLIKSPLWIGKLGSADGGYIDLVGSLGFIGLGLMLMTFVFNYKTLSKIVQDKESMLLTAIVTFFIIHNITETTIFHSTNPLWFLYIFTTFYIAFKVDRKLKALK